MEQPSARLAVNALMYGLPINACVEGETEESVMEGLSIFSYLVIQSALLLMHVQSDNLIQNAQWFYNTALPGAKYLILYKNAELLHVDRTERIFALFTYE